MDRRFLELYNQELLYMRKMGAEFAQQYPKIAGRLGSLDANQPCPDPFVERLLEGFAFLAARVQYKIQAEFPTFTRGILETVFPHVLSPIPSMLMVQFEPDFKESSILNGYSIPKGSSLFSKLGKRDQTRCEYRTAHEVILRPLQIQQGKYYSHELGTLRLPSGPGFEPKAALQLRLQTVPDIPFAKVKPDVLDFYLMGTGEVPMLLLEQLFTNSIGVCLQSVGTPNRWQKRLDAGCIQRVGFDPEESLLPYDPRSFQGYRLLQEYFAFPHRFMFFRLTGLGSALCDCPESQLDFIIALNQSLPLLESSISRDNFSLFCSPAINLFRKRADRIQVTDRQPEFHVVPDRTRPEDYEVYQINRVMGYESQMEIPYEFHPFYAVRDQSPQGSRRFYSLNRIPRAVSERQKRMGRRSEKYPGTEVYLMLSDENSPPFHPDLKQIEVEAMCTNRDLPLYLPLHQGTTDFTMEQAAPYQQIRCIGFPSEPRPALAENEISWHAINHLSLSYLSLSDTEGGDGASALRDILFLYAASREPQITNQISGIRSVQSRPVIRRVHTGGPLAFGRGLEITVTLEEEKFIGTGVFLMGMVLERFFAHYVSINSFTETVIRTVERGEIVRWPARIGIKQTL